MFMSEHISMTDVLKLPVEERLRLIGEIWDSIEAVPEAVVLTDAQRNELEARLEAHRRDPQNVIPWDEVKARILSKR